MNGIILGNGNSRLNFNLNNLSKNAKIYGCNALYRDYIPDVLVSVDPPITNEISAADIPSKCEHYARKPLHNKSKLLTNEMKSGWSSGPIACQIASMQECSRIFLVGFDLVSNTNKINNIYAGTDGYRELNSGPTFYGNWVKQFQEVFENHTQIEYFRIETENIYQPPEWKSISNIKNISVETFHKMLNSI